uniref:Aminotransferase class V domain-containing protein n=1 Tax=Lactuca sativa TaxID=4236 RepID=A0A9R1WN23_LACSA|nr:hypothetical protein LSAT_V11C100044110 [Lactuca sativa]
MKVECGKLIVLTIAEHHSAIVPWQLLSERTGAVLKFVSLTEDEVPDVKMLQELLSKKTKLVVVHHVSNMLGMHYPYNCIFTQQKDFKLYKSKILNCTRATLISSRFMFIATSVLPIKDIAQWAHDVGARILVDACQSVPHMVVDVQNLGVDFLVASSHKMCGPTGVGFLYGKSELLASMPPFLGKLLGHYRVFIFGFYVYINLGEKT